MNTDENPGCLGFLLQLLGIAPPHSGEISGDTTASAKALPYRVRDDFLSPSERAFYGVLCMAVGQRAVVCPKVRLGDIFFVAQPQQNRSMFGRIAQKHVDFLLCDPATMRPLLGVELNDSSHHRVERQARDAFVGSVFQVANLPLLPVPVQSGYSLPELTAQIDALLTQGAGIGAPDVAVPPRIAPPRTRDNDGNIPIPQCPKCEIPMILRTAKQGAGRGLPFYGCPNYPRCRQTKASVGEATP